MAINGATLAFRRRAMGIPKGVVASRLGVTKSVLADWEAGRVRVPADVSTTVENWWSKFVNRVVTAVDGTLDMIEARPGDVCDGVTIYAYRTPEAHAAAEGDEETLYEHSAVVAAIVTALAAEAVPVRVEWKEVEKNGN